MKKGKYQLERFRKTRNLTYEVGRDPIIYEVKLQAFREGKTPKEVAVGLVSWEEYRHVSQCTDLVLEMINGSTRMFNDPTLRERLRKALFKVLARDEEHVFGERRLWKVDFADFYDEMAGFECNEGVSIYQYIEDYMDERLDFVAHTQRFEGFKPKMPEDYLEWCDALAVRLVVLEVDYTSGESICQTGDSLLLDLDTQSTDLLLEVENPRSMGGNGFIFLVMHPVQLNGDHGMVLYADECVAMNVVGVV